MKGRVDYLGLLFEMCLRFQEIRMEVNMVASESGDKIIAMVVFGLASYADLDFVITSSPRGLQKILGKQLPLLIEVVAGAIIDKDMKRILCLGYQFRCIVFLGTFFDTSLKIARERFLPPGALGWVRNGRKC